MHMGNLHAVVSNAPTCNSALGPPLCTHGYIKVYTSRLFEDTTAHFTIANPLPAMLRRRGRSIYIAVAACSTSDFCRSWRRWLDKFINVHSLAPPSSKK